VAVAFLPPTLRDEWVSCSNFMKYYICIGLVLIAFAGGFFLGRGKVRTSVKTEYIKGETVVRPVKIPYPSTVFIPTLYFLPTKSDTLYLDGEAQFVQTVDTAKIIEEYITQNTYEFNVFDDSNGKLDIKQTIQYNRLNDFSYTFTPIYRHTTVSEKPIFEPFVSIGYSTFNQAFIGGGVFYKDVGIEYNYIQSNTLGGHSLSIKYKF
jgi:hypothetical protein